MRLIFLGFGTIGRIIYSEITRKALPTLQVIGALDPALSPDAIHELESQGLAVFHRLEDIIRNKPDLVVEAASQQAAKECVPVLIDQGIDVLSMSVGAYLDPEMSERVRGGGKGRLLFSSGALPGVDVLKAAAVREIRSAELTTRKPPRALAGAPGLARLEVDLSTVTEPLTVFRGSASEAVKLFPANVNIAATLSLAGVGAERTRVTIIADPTVKTNIHSIHLSGDFGTFDATIQCLPSSNPKTSLIAALSAVALLESLVSPVRIGT